MVGARNKQLAAVPQVAVVPRRLPVAEAMALAVRDPASVSTLLSSFDGVDRLQLAQQLAVKVGLGYVSPSASDFDRVLHGDGSGAQEVDAKVAVLGLLVLSMLDVEDARRGVTQ